MTVLGGSGDRESAIVRLADCSSEGPNRVKDGAQRRRFAVAEGDP
jgi:hypothetical protein